MAPVFMANRLLLSLYLVCLLFLSLDITQIRSLLVYDRQWLLNLQPNVKELGAFDHGRKS